MKIIYLSNIRIPTEKAHGYQIAKTCEALVKSGVQLELWVPTRKNSLTQNVFEFYSLKQQFLIKKIKSFDFLRFSFLGKYGFWLQSQWFLLKLIFKNPPKGAWIYSRQPEIIWLFALKGYKTIFEAHNFSKKTKLYSFFVRNVDHIVVLTRGIKDLMVKNKISSEKILVVPDGVDLKNFDLAIAKKEARIKLGLGLDKIILGYSGSFQTMGEDKGIKDILAALKLLQSKDKNILFIAVGAINDQEIEFYAKLSQELSLDNNTLFLRRVSLEKLALYQKAFDILLMPFPFSEHYAYYMSPLKMFEYMASQRPIIATNLPSIKEILNTRNAFLISPDNPEALAKKINYILENKEEGQKIAEQAYQDVKKYTWEKRAKNILGFIKQVL